MIENTKLKSEEGFKYINRRYATALLATATLLLISQVIIQLAIMNMKDDARIVNISGRQRMLSQKITKCAFGLQLADTKESRKAFLAELVAASALWRHSHEALRYGSKAMHLPGGNSPAVEALFQKMEPHYQGILKAVGSIILAEEADIATPAVKAVFHAIRDNETEFLKYMDRIVFQYDEESNAKLFRLQLLEFSILTIALLVLAFEWRIVFKPAQKEIKAGFDVMKKNEEYLNQLFETAPTLTILFDSVTLKAVKFNAMAVQLVRDWLGVELSEDTSFGEIVPGPEKNEDLSARLLDKLQAEKSFSNLEVGITADKIVLMSAKTIMSGGKKLYLVGLSDITTLKQVATFDSMTAMLNRRAGLELLGYLFDECARNNTGMVLCFIDIDRLKYVNDMHGHQEGDWYIKAVARAINQQMGDECKSIRYGGDEIILVTENPDLAAFENKLQNVGEVLYRVGHENFKPYRMSVSHGFAIYPNATARSVSDLIEEADMSMYEHKKAKKAQRQTEEAH